MTQYDIRDENVLWESVVRWLPVFSPEEQRAGMVVLRELAKGVRTTIAQFARALGTPLDMAGAFVKNSALSPFVHTDEQGQIQGFWGLSVIPTHHQLRVNGRTLWTWCAYDALFMPELLGETAEIESREPESNHLIRLTVSPDRIETVDRAGIVLSMGRADTWDQSSAARVIASACHYIFFFTSHSAGELWQAKHPKPETVLLSLDSAVDFGRRSNAHLFGTELARRKGEQVSRQGRPAETAGRAHG